MKGVSQIILVLLILIVAISAISVLWLYFSGLLVNVVSSGSTSTLTNTLSSCMNIDSVKGNKVYLRNCGSGVVTNSSLRVYFDNAPVNFSMSASSLGSGQTGVITLYGLWGMSIGENYKLKITTPSATIERYVKAVLPDSSVLDLEFDEGSGSTAYDSSPYGSNGTITNTTNGTITWVSGISGSALNFSVNSSINGPYVSLPFESYLNVSQPVTISAWVYPTNFPAYIISRTTCCGTTLLYMNSNKFQVAWGNYTDSSYVTLSGGTINLRAWYFVSFSYSLDGSVNIYVNGVNVGSTSKNATNYSDVLNKNWIIGYSWSGAQSFNGTIDEVRIYNQALTPDQTISLSLGELG